MHTYHIRILATILAFSLLTLIGSEAMAAPHQTLKIKASADADALEKGLTDIGVNLMGKCMANAGENTPAVREKCLCAHRSEVNSDLVTMEKVLARHPTWKDKLLSWQEHGGQDSYELPAYNVAMLRGMSNHCP